MRAGWSSTIAAGCALAVASCAVPPLVVAPGPAAPTTCPIDGCNASGWIAPEPALALCGGAQQATCAGAPAAECARRALGLWSNAPDDRTVGCVARMLAEACSLGDARSCTFAGRLALDGRGAARDPARGVDMLVRACDGGERLACLVAVRWLAEPGHAHELPDAADLRKRLEEEHACFTSEPEACYQVGLLFYFGAESFPKDRARAVQAYERGCDLGDARACNNLGDALEYGEGVERDLAHAATIYEKACGLGESLACANSGRMFENGAGVVGDRVRARALYRESCAGGEGYGCLHEEMLAAQDAGVPRDVERALSLWQRSCDRRDARACAFVGVLYEDGAEGLPRDGDKSLEAMNPACSLGNTRACEWVKSRGGP